MNKTLEDVIEKYWECLKNQDKEHWDSPKFLAQAIRQYYLEKLPKEKIYSKYRSDVRSQEECDWYNQAIRDMRKEME